MKSFGVLLVFAASLTLSLAWVVEEKKCGPREAWVACPLCLPTCKDPNPLYCHRFLCEEGCGCQPSFVRHNGECISRKECPNLKENALAPSHTKEQIQCKKCAENH
uniref:TIL domain-containing protein n=1 Tax=Steinernema glaseri TaxID=37863 RepID=A0A1I8AVA5_9BILA